MNLLATIAVLAVISNIGITLFLLLKGKKVYTLLFSFVSLSLTLWNFAMVMFSMLSSNKYGTVMFWWQIGYIGAISAPMFYFHFVLKFLDIKKRSPIIISYFLGLFFIFLNLFNKSNYFLGNLRFVFQQFYWHDWIENRCLMWLMFYVIFYWIIPGYAFWLLLKNYNYTHKLIRNQIKYLILGSLLGWIGGEMSFLYDFRIDIYYTGAIATLFVCVHPLILTYAIVRHRLMEIEVIIRRAVVFAGLFGSVFAVFLATTIYGQQLIADIFGITNRFVMATFAVLIITIIYQPLRTFLLNITDRFLLQKKCDYQKILKEASVGMAQVTELKKLVSLITHVVSSKLRTSHVSIFLFDEDKNYYKLITSRGRDKLHILTSLNTDNPLLNWLLDKKEILSLEDINYRLENKRLLLRDRQLESTLKKIKTQMQELKAELCVPAFIKEKFIGLMVLGEKLSRDLYSQTDLTLLSTLAHQAALAIENANFYEDVKETQAQLLQAEKMATVGTMADGLSHQMNNRLNALGLIAADTLDTIKRMDLKKCSKEVQDVIEQIKHSFERIEANVQQGGEIVRGLLKYSRTGATGVEAISLDTIVNSAMEMAQYKVKLEQFDFIRNYPKDGPLIKGNPTQLQEVFFNLIDNAYDAIVERKDTLKELNYRGRIGISAEREETFLKIVIQDNGMGVAEENQKRLFTPFFTTKVSSRKGTGLGLYVIQRIITENHGGKIAVSSVYKQGTRFVVELPLAK